MSSRLNNPKFLKEWLQCNGNLKMGVGGNYSSFTGTENYSNLNPFGKQCLTLDGSSYAKWLNNSSMNITSLSFSLSIWINPTLAGNQYVLSNDTFNANGWELWIGSVGGMYFLTNQASAYQQTTIANGSFVANAPRHVVYTQLNGIGNFYLDTVPQAKTKDDTHIAAVSSTTFALGSSIAGSFPFTGKLWGLKVWNCCLSRDEIIALNRRDRR
jgi:hypothetical protein